MDELEQSLRDLLERDAQDFDPLSRDRILDALAQSGNSRPSRVRLWGGVVAACAITASVIAGVAVMSDGGDHRSFAPSDDGEKPAPDLAETRQAGLHGVVVTVPVAWPTTDAVCDAPPESYVYFDSEGRRSARCPHIERGAEPETVVGIGDSDSATGQWVTRGLRMPGRPVDGFEVLESAVTCEEPAVVLCFQTFVVPELGTYFTVMSHGDGAMEQVAAIRESLQVLPEGYTTVPFAPNHTLDARIKRIEAAGLSVELVEQSSAEHEAGFFLGADPAPGTAVAEGTTVTLTVSARVDGASVR